MNVSIYITVEDIADQLETYTQIKVERATSVAGAYSVIDTITLAAGQFVYTFIDSGGTLNSWYRYRLYNPTGPVADDYSNPFQPEGVTLKKIRQEAIEHYEQGMVLTAKSSGSSSTVIPTNDYRFKSTLYRTDRGKGGWLKFTTGNHAGEISRVIATDPTAGTFTVSPAWAAVSLADGDEFEWHWLVDPTRWDRAINSGLGRYYYLDELPLTGVGVTENEYDLHAYYPWLKRKEDVFGVWYYPLATTANTVVGRQEPWAGSGRWSGVREDNGRLTLRVLPGIDTTATLYIEAARPMPPLYTDDSLAVPKCALDFIAALAYDEVLASLVRPGAGASKDVETWKAERLMLQAELKPLIERETLSPRPFPSQTIEPQQVWQPWNAR